jgi:tripartite-type tricarboxylate transporter receptor subunit TctC
MTHDETRGRAPASRTAAAGSTTARPRGSEAMPRFAPVVPVRARAWHDAAESARWVACIGAAITLAPLGAVAHAQSAYPVRPVRLIAPFPPGGSSDLIARVLAQRLTEALPHPVLIDNRPGAGSNLGTQLAARAVPDGHTLLLGSVTNAINATLYRDPGYDLMRDFSPISKLAIGPNALVVHPSVPARSVAELVRLARARPGQLNYGSGGSGTTSHLSGEMLRSMAGIDIVHIPYKGTGQSVGDLVAGHIHFVFASMPVVMPQMKAGRLRALAVTGAQRTPQAPDLPTVAEAGIAGYAFDTWWSLLAPAGTAPAIVTQLNGEVRRILALPDVRQRFAELGIDVLPSTPAELGEFTRSEIERLAKIIRQTGLKAE